MMSTKVVLDKSSASSKCLGTHRISLTGVLSSSIGTRRNMLTIPVEVEWASHNTNGMREYNAFSTVPDDITMLELILEIDSACPEFILLSHMQLVFFQLDEVVSQNHRKGFLTSNLLGTLVKQPAFVQVKDLYHVAFIPDDEDYWNAEESVLDVVLTHPSSHKPYFINCRLEFGFRITLQHESEVMVRIMSHTKSNSFFIQSVLDAEETFVLHKTLEFAQETSNSKRFTKCDAIKFQMFFPQFRKPLTMSELYFLCDDEPCSITPSLHTAPPALCQPCVRGRQRQPCMAVIPGCMVKV